MGEGLGSACRTAWQGLPGWQAVAVRRRLPVMRAHACGRAGLDARRPPVRARGRSSRIESAALRRQTGAFNGWGEVVTPGRARVGSCCSSLRAGRAWETRLAEGQQLAALFRAQAGWHAARRISKPTTSAPRAASCLAATAWGCLAFWAACAAHELCPLLVWIAGLCWQCWPGWPEEQGVELAILFAWTADLSFLVTC